MSSDSLTVTFQQNLFPARSFRELYRSRTGFATPHNGANHLLLVCGGLPGDYRLSDTAPCSAGRPRSNHLPVHI